MALGCHVTQQTEIILLSLLGSTRTSERTRSTVLFKIMVGGSGDGTNAILAKVQVPIDYLSLFPVRRDVSYRLHPQFSPLQGAFPVAALRRSRQKPNSSSVPR